MFFYIKRHKKAFYFKRFDIRMKTPKRLIQNAWMSQLSQCHSTVFLIKTPFCTVYNYIYNYSISSYLISRNKKTSVTL